MSSFNEPNQMTVTADNEIALGEAVGYGSANGRVVVASANTQRAKGIAQSVASGSNNRLVIALPGGGGQGLLGEAVNAGDSLVPHTDGSLVKPNASGDKICARAEQDGASGDVIEIRVLDTDALASE